jgi:hypothetical protein
MYGTPTLIFLPRKAIMHTDPFASTPDYIAPEIAIPLMVVFWAIWFVLGSEQRREARKARKAMNQ